MKKVDFSEFDYIFGMDDDNIDDLKSMAPNQCKAKVELLGSYDPEGERIIRDPYYVSFYLLAGLCHLDSFYFHSSSFLILFICPTGQWRSRL